MNIAGAIFWAALGGGLALEFEHRPFGVTITAGLACVGYVVYQLWPRRISGLPDVAAGGQSGRHPGEEPPHPLPEQGWGDARARDDVSLATAPQWRSDLPSDRPIDVCIDPPEAFDNLPEWLQVTPERIRQPEERGETGKKKKDRSGRNES